MYTGWQKSRSGDTYEFTGYTIVDDVKDEFSTVSLADAIAAFGLTTVGSFVAGLLEKAAWSVTSAALGGLGILLGVDQLSEQAYLEELENKTRTATADLNDNDGEGCVVVETDFYRYVGGSGNYWSDEKEFVTNVYFQS